MFLLLDMLLVGADRGGGGWFPTHVHQLLVTANGAAQLILNAVPGALISSLLLAPNYCFTFWIFFQYRFQLILREGVQLLNPDDCCFKVIRFCPRVDKTEVDLATAKHDSCHCLAILNLRIIDDIQESVAR